MTEQSWMDGLMRVFAYNRETCPALSLENGGPNNDYVGEGYHRHLEQLAKAAMTTLKTGKKYSAT